MTKELHEQVFPVENYTDKVHTGIKMMFQCYPNLTFTLPQMVQHLQKGYTWLADITEEQTDLLKKLINTGIKKCIQQGIAIKVTSNVSTDSQWKFRTNEANGYTSLTSNQSVAVTEEAKKAIKRRAISPMTLHRLNNAKPLNN